jgi:hypothetical protein
MDIWTIDKLELFIGFVVPGFIALKAYDLISPSEQKDSTKQIVDAVTYSCINYAIMLFPIYLVESYSLKTSHSLLYVSFYTYTILINPILLVWGFYKLRQQEWFMKIAPHPTLKPWDFVFSKRKTYWIVVTLKNGQKIGGLYAGDSFVSSYPAPEQIYLEEEWVLNEDGGFDRKATRTAGIIILGSEICCIELRTIGDDDE